MVVQTVTSVLVIAHTATQLSEQMVHMSQLTTLPCSHHLKPSRLSEDLAELRRVPWRYLVVDEAHRLKNKDSALAQDLRSLQVARIVGHSGTMIGSAALA